MTDARRNWRLYGLVVLLGLALSLPAGAATPQQVETAIQKAVESLYKRQKNENWEGVPAPVADAKEWETSGKQWGGLTAIATYALLASGQSPQEARLKPAIEFLVKSDLNGTYALAMRCQVWNLLPKSPEVRRMAVRDAAELRESMKINGPAKGLFSYYNDRKAAGRYDHSCSNYGVLGLWACADMDLEIPKDQWETMEAGWRGHQLPDGGWSYVHNARDKSGQPTLSMTSAGVATLFVTRDFVHAMDGIACTGNQTDANIDRGMQWMVRNFSKYKEAHAYYTLYNIERVGVASGYKYFGPVNWYEEGADFLVKSQRWDGSWGNVQDTSWGILFLTRGRSPVAINKLDYTPEGKGAKVSWNQRPRDAANLSRWIGKQIERDLNWQIVNLGAPAEELHDSPILYISGSDALNFTDADRAKLKAFVEQGGLIVGNADCGRKPFADSFVKLGRQMFPGYEFRELPEKHPIYDNQLFRREEWRTPPALHGLSNGVREFMLLFPAGDPAKGWQMGAFLGPERSPPAQVMANVFLYAVDKQNLRYKGEQFLVGKDPKVKAGPTVRLARLEYAGNWDPEPAGWRRMTTLLHNQYGVNLDVRPVKLGTGALDKQFHAAHLTGTAAVKLDGAARAELKKYVEAGGTLLIDAAGGAVDFAAAVESELRELFPAGQLTLLKNDHPVFNAAGPAITEVEYRAFARRSVGNVKQSRLRGIDLGGRTAVVYSAEDLGTGLVGQPVDGIVGYEPKSAAALTAGVLLSAAKVRIDAAKVAGAKGAAPAAGAAKSVDMAKAVAQLASGWAIENCGTNAGVGYKEDLFGKKGVLTTHPKSQTTPCTLTKVLALPVRRSATLRLTVGHPAQGDWDLIVKVDGKEVKKQTVGPATAKSGWLEVPVDLSSYAGKEVKVQLVNQPTGWSNEFAYWSEIKLEVK